MIVELWMVNVVAGMLKSYLYSDHTILIGGIKFSFVHCGEVFNTVSLYRKVL